MSDKDNKKGILTIYEGSDICPKLGIGIENDSFRGWLFSKLPKGQWVTLADLSKVSHLIKPFVKCDAKAHNGYQKEGFTRCPICNIPLW